MASTQLGVPVASLTVDQRRRLRRRQDRHVRRADRRQALQLHDAHRRRVDSRSRRRARASRSRSASTRSSATRSPRIDIPAKVTGTYTYVQNVRVPGHAPRPHRASARRRAPTRRRTHVRSASTRARSATSRALRSSRSSNFLAVVAPKEYDAIQAAAQLKVVWKSDPKFGSGSPATSGSGCAQAGDTNTDEPGPLHRGLPATSTRRSQAAAKTVSATYKYHYNGFMPIGPHCAVADVKARRQRRRSTSRARRSPASRRDPTVLVSLAVARHPGREHPRDLVRGLELVRRRPDGEVDRAGSASSRRRSASRCACSGCAGTSTAGTTTAPPHMYDVRWPRRRDRQDRRRGLDDLRPGAEQHRRPDGAARHGDVAGGSGRGGPTPSDWQRRTPTRTRLRRAYSTSGGCSRRRSRCTAGRSSATSSGLRTHRSQYFASEQIVDELAHAANMDPIAFRRLNIDATIDARRALAVGARRGRRSPRAGSRRLPLRTCRPATSSPAAASASARSPRARSASSPTSR